MKEYLDLKIFYEILVELNKVGIDKTIMEPSENGFVVRGIDANESIITVDEIDSPSAIPAKFAVQSVKTLKNRFELFDYEDLPELDYQLEYQDEESVKTLTLKKGRKKVRNTFSPISAIQAPLLKNGISFNIISTINFDKEQTDSIIQAIQAMNHRDKSQSTITLYNEDGYNFVQLSDGVSDNYVDTIGESNASEDWRGSWLTESFKKLISEASKNNSSFEVKVTDKRILLIRVNHIEFMIADMPD